jgi:hypothetical protein
MLNCFVIIDFQEINFMKSLKFHPHVLCLLGYVQDATKPLMILEYCANNSLLCFIRKNKVKFIEVIQFSGKLTKIVFRATKTRAI